MKEKYRIDTEQNREFLRGNLKSLLKFGRQFPSESGASFSILGKCAYADV